jgi:hypothetical protein
MKAFLQDLIAKQVPIAFVGGSDLVKLKEQLGEDRKETSLNRSVDER